MKISKRTREQAALICAIAASNDTALPYWIVASDIGIEHEPSVSLAIAAHAAVSDFVSNSDGADAEAESLLRTGFVPVGWSP